MIGNRASDMSFAGVGSEKWRKYIGGQSKREESVKELVGRWAVGGFGQGEKKSHSDIEGYRD